MKFLCILIIIIFDRISILRIEKIHFFVVKKREGMESLNASIPSRFLIQIMLFPVQLTNPVPFLLYNVSDLSIHKNLLHRLKLLLRFIKFFTLIFPNINTKLSGFSHITFSESLTLYLLQNLLSLFCTTNKYCYRSSIN